MSEQEFFFRYTCKHIDPALQRILRREDSVIVALARYLIRDKIVEKKKEEKRLTGLLSNRSMEKGQDLA
jgi:hypothetical protein